MAIETALALRQVFRLPLRQAERFLRSLFKLMDVDLDAPDHPTLSRRSASLDVSLARRTSAGPIDLIIDSSGLAIVGEGEWAAAKHGGNGRRGWKKLHLGVDACGEIVAQVLTNSNVDDGTMGAAIINDMGDRIQSVTADAAYDTKPIYDAAAGQGAEVVVPPSSTASTSTRCRRSKARNRTVRRVKEIGRRQWKKESGVPSSGPSREHVLPLRVRDRRTSSGAAGTFDLLLDLTMVPTPTGFVSVQPGETWNFQAWHRDANPTVTSNFRDAVAVTFE